MDSAFLAEGSVSLDGKTVWPLAPSTTTTTDTPGIDVTASLTAGTSHTFATTVQAGADTVSGVRGEAWIEFIPTPAATLNLAGSWATSNDGFSFSGAPITLPGAWETAAGGGISGAQTTTTVPSTWSGTDVVLAVASALGLGDVIVNGQWIHAADGWLDTQNTVRVNVTPYIAFGATNTFALFPFGGAGSACKQASCVTRLELESFPANGLYP